MFYLNFCSCFPVIGFLLFALCFSQLISPVYWIFNHVDFTCFAASKQMSDVKIIVHDGPHSIIFRSRIFFHSFSQ